MHTDYDPVLPPAETPVPEGDPLVPGLCVEPVAVFRVRVVLRETPLPGEISPAAEVWAETFREPMTD